MKLFGTGHRELDHPEALLREEIGNTLLEAKPELVIVGMASGFDLILGDVAREMRVPYVCVRPWRGHEPRRNDENLYLGVWNFASETYDTSDSDDYPGPHVYQMRNAMMVDMATHGLAYFSGKAGGTANCIQYAHNKNKKVRNIYDRIPPF